MSTELITILGGAAATVISAVASALLTRRKYTTETRRTELDNVREGVKILMEQIVTPLKREINSLRNDLKKFHKAIEKIPGCPRAADCPVSRELHAHQEGDDDHAADGGG